MAGEARDEGPAKGGAARPVVAAASGRKAARDCPAATRQSVPAEEGEGAQRRGNRGGGSS